MAIATLAQIPATQAAPVIQVKARTDIKLDPILRSGSRLIVSGRLIDRATDDGLRGLRIWVYFDRSRRTTLTDDDGKFEVRFIATSGKHNLVVMFSGDARHSPSSVELKDFDASKNPLTLSVELPKEVPYPPKKLQARITAKSSDSPVRVPVSIAIIEASGATTRPETHTVPTVTTDAKGEALATLPAAKLGKPGRKIVELTFPGDDSYDAARARTEVLLVTATSLTAELDDDSIAFESSAKITGTLKDNANQGLALGRILVMANGKRVGNTVTKADGSYEVKVGAKQLGAGTTKLAVRFEANRSWRKSSYAKPLSVTVGEPKPVPVGYTLAAFGATALALLAFVGLRAKPWRNWAWLNRGDLEEELDERDEIVERPPVQTGLQVARPSLVSTLRRAADNGFAGVVRDAVTGAGLANARVEMIDTGDGAAVTETAGDGAFTIEDLTNGHWRATVRCPGYCSERFPVTIPHRGELRGVRIDMLPVRERIFEMYRTAAHPLLPDHKDWGIWTPRQIVDHVRKSRPRPALAALTEFVEETYFSQRTPGEDILERASALVRDARIESGR